MISLRNPSWIKKLQAEHASTQNQEQLFDQINARLKEKVSQEPVVSVVIPAYNEEKSILLCIDSLSRMETEIPFEILIVNNNSTDLTQQILDKLHLRWVNQSVQGSGPARQMGLEQAKGNYILTADSDSYYPKHWLTAMYKGLTKEGIVCAYGRFSFLGDSYTSRWKFAFYEALKNVVVELKHLKRPHLNCGGANMGFVRERALQVGYDMRGKRGEDGRLAFDLAQFGKIAQVRNHKARIWTGSRILHQDGNLFQAMLVRFRKEGGRLLQYFAPQSPHNTKTS